MNILGRAMVWLLGGGIVGLTALMQVGLRLLYWLFFILGFLLLVILIFFMLLGHLSPFSPKLAVIWAACFQMFAGFGVLLVVDLGLYLVQGVTIACMSYRKQ
jgi:hypothetical protein